MLSIESGICKFNNLSTCEGIKSANSKENKADVSSCANEKTNENNTGENCSKTFKNKMGAPFKKIGGGIKSGSGRLKNAIKELTSHPLFYTIPPLVIAAAGMVYGIPSVLHVGLRHLTPEQQNEFMDKVEPGDVLLVTEQIQYPSFIPQKIFAKSRYSHGAMAVDKGTVIEASMGKGGISVHETPMDKVVNDHTMDVAILRPFYDNKSQKDKAIQYLKEQVGKPFDFGFNLFENDKFYCSKLAYYALKHAGVNAKVPIINLLDKKMILPDSFLKAKGVNLVKEFHGE